MLSHPRRLLTATLADLEQFLVADQ